MQNKVGSYAISVINFDDWNAEQIYSSQKGKKGKGSVGSKAKKDIVHPVLAEGARYISDPYWVERINLAACGKFSRGFMYRDGKIIHKKGNKYNSIVLGENAYETVHAFISFMRTYGNIRSPTDEQNEEEAHQRRLKEAAEQNPITWKDANKKLQESMICNYITTMKDVMKLSKSEAEQLRSIVKYGINNKYFTKENITLKENRIYTIDGLLWNAENRSFFISPTVVPKVTRRSSKKCEEYADIFECTQKDMIPQFRNRWNKYIDQMEKKVDSAIRRSRRLANNVTTLGYNHDTRLPTLVLTSSSLLSPTNFTSVTDATDVTDVTDVTDDEDSTSVYDSDFSDN